MLQLRYSVNNDDPTAKDPRIEVSPAESAVENINQVQVKTSLEYFKVYLVQSFSTFNLLPN